MLLATVVAIATTAVLAAVLIPIMRHHAIDVPTHRSSHTDPTPRGGGIALVAGIAAGAATLGTPDTVGLVIFATAVVLAVVGLVDDLRGLGPMPRLLVQVAAPIPVVWWLASDSTDSTTLAILLACIGVLWMAGFVNAFNFMDGINGIAAVALVVAGVTQALIGHVDDHPLLESAGLLGFGAAIGFMPWNYPRARLFMGDVGSYFVGAWLGGLVVFGISREIHPIAMLAPATLFVLDTGFTLIRRGMRRRRVTQAHREHIYQRTVAAGWSHARMTATYGVLSALISIGGITWVFDEPRAQIAGSVLAVAAVAVYFTLPRVAAAGTDD